MFQYQIARCVNGIRVLGDDLKNKCHSSCGMLKNTHCSVAVIGYHSSKNNNGDFSIWVTLYTFSGPTITSLYKMPSKFSLDQKFSSINILLTVTNCKLERFMFYIMPPYCWLIFLSEVIYLKPSCSKVT